MTWMSSTRSGGLFWPAAHAAPATRTLASRVSIPSSESIHHRQAEVTPQDRTGDERVGSGIRTLELSGTWIAFRESERIRDIVDVSIQIEALGNGKARAQIQ